VNNFRRRGQENADYCASLCRNCAAQTGLSFRGMREGPPTIRVRTFNHDGETTGEVILDSRAAEHLALNLPLALEGLAMLIDATGGVHHGGGSRVGTEDGSLEIAWTENGRFDD
jgi:hypothetical protein